MKIVIWTGPAWEDWGPWSIDDGGIGGSETAAVWMGRELARLGHEVVVYGQLGEGKRTQELLFDGKSSSPIGHVDFADYRLGLAPGALECDVFISSRDKQAWRLNPKARLKVLWMHDFHVGDDWEDDIGKFDRVFCLSEWAKAAFLDFYPQVPPHSVMVTRNGLDLERFLSPPLKEEPPRFTYSSSPNRGLDVLLDLWPKIRALAPGATLHVYYGFETWRKMVVAMKNHQTQMLQLRFFEQRIQRMEDQGVVYHGRVGQKEISDSQIKSLLWLYPTEFRETSCITAMEAQAAGAVPICTALAALKETVKHGVLIPPYNDEPRYEKEFLGAIDALLGDHERREALAFAGQKHAFENLSWAGVAKKWAEYFEEACLDR